MILFLHLLVLSRHLHLSYQLDNGTKYLGLATKIISWSSEIVSYNPGTGKYSNIIPIDNSIGIAYQDNTKDDLIYTYKENGCIIFNYIKYCVIYFFLVFNKKCLYQEL